MVTAERTKVDLVRERADFFHAGAEPRLVHLVPARYLTLDGGGAPTKEDGAPTDFQVCIEALYAVAYAVKQRCKQDGHDFRVPPLQASWLPFHGFGDCERDLTKVDAANWRWTLMIMVPDFVDEATVEAAMATKVTTDGAASQRIRLEVVDDGLCVQVLHVGPYGEEHHAIRALRRFMERIRVRPCGLHQEIYLNDPTRTAPDKLRVILRQPVRAIEDATPCMEDEW